MEHRKPEDRVLTYTNPGAMVKSELAPKLDKYGNRQVLPTGKEINLYAYIQSWADATDLNLLLARYTSGDKTALMQRAGAYLDVSSLPDNFNDLFNTMTRSESLFDSLPVEVKEMFGNNYLAWMSNIGTDEWNSIMNMSPDDIRKEKVLKAKMLKEKNMDLTETIHDPISVEVPTDSPVVENPGTKGLNEI